MDYEANGLLQRMSATLKSIQFCLVIFILGIFGFTALIQMELLQVREELKQIRAKIDALAPHGK